LHYATYNVFSEPTAVTYGSGDTDAFSYDPNTGRMKQYTASADKLLQGGALIHESVHHHPERHAELRHERQSD
jgi:hypothetical protein